jgi:hypothetical protein
MISVICAMPLPMSPAPTKPTFVYLGHILFLSPTDMLLLLGV